MRELNFRISAAYSDLQWFGGGRSRGCLVFLFATALHDDPTNTDFGRVTFFCIAGRTEQSVGLDIAEKRILSLSPIDDFERYVQYANLLNAPNTVVYGQCIVDDDNNVTRFVIQSDQGARGQGAGTAAPERFPIHQ